MIDWTWVDIDVVAALHEQQLSDHGGPEGIRDRGALLSALVRPQNLSNYEDPDAASLAASYAFGIARNHGFVDGNKRTAWVVANVFLAINAVTLFFEEEDAVNIMLALAAGELSENQLAAWFREHIVSA